MNVLLVSIPHEFPLGVYCLAASLSAAPETADCTVEILSLEASKLNSYNRKDAETWRYIAHLEALRPEVVAFSVFLWSHMATLELISVTRQIHPGATIVVGGPEMASMDSASSWVESWGADVAIRGEGERTLVEVIGRIRAAAGEPVDLAGVAGCTWARRGEVVHEARRPPVHDLSTLPSPYLSGLVGDDLFDRHAPSDPHDVTTGRFPRALIETYRGCYMQCSYCQWGNGTKERFEFPWRRVREELTWILERRLRAVWIVDAMFGFKKRIAKDILRHIIAEKARCGADTVFVCYHNQDFYDEELFDLYREAGVTIEVDLQSTDTEVLDRVGRGKWSTDSFDRHLRAFRRQGVPTSGAADLILGLPRDHLEAFESSVSFLLERRMKVSLFQTSVIPDTPLERSALADGLVVAETPPRAVLRTPTFPVADLVKARLVGHGVDVFRIYPRTAQLLWRLGYERPVDLCKRIGDLVWRRHDLMYGESRTSDAALAEQHDLVAGLLDDLCAEPWHRPVVRDVFELERAAAAFTVHELPFRRAPRHPILAPDEVAQAERVDWLAARPRFRSEAVEEVVVRHRIDRILPLLDAPGPLPERPFWSALRCTPLVALVYRRGPRHTGYRLVDRELTHPLLQRLSGYFTVAQCLESIAGAGWRFLVHDDLWRTLDSLYAGGFVEAGERVADAGGMSVDGSAPGA